MKKVEDSRKGFAVVRIPVKFYDGDHWGTMDEIVHQGVKEGVEWELVAWENDIGDGKTIPRYVTMKEAPFYCRCKCGNRGDQGHITLRPCMEKDTHANQMNEFGSHYGL